ncbi:MAG: quinoprotein dehydrogenase-associated putative ABC transporter substrate-binding protein [Trueperaceae bacterium]
MRSARWATAFLLSAFLLLLGVAHAQQWDLRICAQGDSLPYSNRQGQGFENRIAELLARELGVNPVHVWLPRPDNRVRDALLRSGECDVVMGVNDGHAGFLTSLAYYRSSYVFVYRRDSPFDIESLDDPVLGELRVGVQVAGRGVSPPTLALANRGLLDRQVGVVPDYDEPAPLARLIGAVAAGEVDVAIAWGPVAGYFAASSPVPMEVVPVSPKIEQPFVPMVSSIALGVRPGDEALRDRLDLALARTWEEIQSILREYRIPLEPLPAPTVEGS